MPDVSVTTPRIALGASGAIDTGLGLVYGTLVAILAVNIGFDTYDPSVDWWFKFTVVFGGGATPLLALLLGGTIRLFAAVTLTGPEQLRRATRLGGLSLVPLLLLAPVLTCGQCFLGGKAAAVAIALTCGWAVVAVPAGVSVFLTRTHARRFAAVGS